ncbi:tRNA(His) guanylyltransferase Thg1 family protein [Vibrio jasicida]|uniref:tRNA(His) guanylyltransferase Thg1 family protein n=1 Tax=Vibrio jasicida TaxID=766224 RepID=UPI0040684AF5
MDIIEKFTNMDEHFKEIEKKTELLSTYSSDGYLVLRLDGIGLSKKYLKDSIRSKRFEGLMWEAMDETFQALHRKCPHDSQNIILGAIICSDEVSIILSNIPNYYDNRIMKVLTTFVSTYTHFFTLIGMRRASKKNKQFITGSFDGRALLLNDLDEVSDYMKHRYAVGIRNSLTKLVRLSRTAEDEEIYGNENFNNLSYIFKKLSALDSSGDMLAVFQSPIVFVSNEKELINSRFESIDELSTWINNGLKEQQAWLEKFV